MYEKPRVEYLGTVRELTKTLKHLGFADGYFLATPDGPVTIGDRS